MVVPFTAAEGAPEVSAGRFTGQVTEELRSRDDAVELVGAPAFTKTDRPAKATKPSPEATLALETGKKLLADLKFDEAAPALKKGVELSLADPATADFPAVTEALVSLAVSYFRMGSDDDGQKTLAQLARIDPGYTIPSGYPPAFVREFEKAKKRLDKQGRGSISVEGPAGSTVFIDGHDLGMVPVLEENLPFGTHYVKVEGSRGERFGQVAELKGGMLKVKGSFGGPPDKAGGVADPRIGATLDEATATRVQAYAKAANAEYAIVGVLYRTGEQQLTAGTALFSARRGGFAPLPPVSFDADAMTSNVEAYKLVEEIVKRVQSYGSTVALPLNLITKKVVTVGSVATTKEAEAGGGNRVAARPKLTPDPDVRPLENKSVYVDSNGPGERPPEATASSGPPKWIWFVVGAAVVAGAGVGGYFMIKEATRPVTGTVTAQW
ncbi:MAG: PEGA domain-containing protein [Archangiaceae bacterium]|nr:PEGA domain-containing protein [Archangiaceae bacterium]